jgi:acyl carrier protein
MSNLEKYNEAFIESFDISKEELLKENLKYNTIEEWDSIGHMGLMSALEDAFDISLETEDIIEFSDYEKGKEILKKYEVEIV